MMAGWGRPLFNPATERVAIMTGGKQPATNEYETTIEQELEIFGSWARGETCYTGHNAKAEYIVIGMSGKTKLASCGNHVGRAIREVCAKDEPIRLRVTVWVRP